jgi:alcohol dehydrogenase class IV
MRAAGAVEVARASLSEWGISSTIFEVGRTPETEEIDEGAALMRSGGFDMSIGIGGGSALDACKAISLLSANGEHWEAVQAGALSIAHPGPVILTVPTTAGSGSESTTVAVATNKNLGIIKSVSHPFMIPTVAILDPSLITSLSAQLHALSGLDAFSHAIESFTSRRASDLTRRASVTALTLIFESLPRVVSGNSKDEDYSNLMLGSHIAGKALSAGVGAAHILAQPISAVLKVDHGTALSLVLEEVIRFNEELPENPYRALIATLTKQSDSSLLMSNLVGDFMTEIQVVDRAMKFGGVEAIPLILDAVRESTGHIWTNPRDVSIQALEKILRRSWV